MKANRPAPTPKRWGFRRRATYVFFILTIPPLMRLLYRVNVDGVENVPEEGTGIILAANHQSFLDPFFIASMIPFRLCLWFGSQKVMSKKYFSWVKYCGAFAVNTEGGGKAERGINYSAALVCDGRAVAIFLEGKRSHSGKLGRPRSGLGRIAHRCRGKVIPVSIEGARHALPRGNSKVKARPAFRVPIQVIFGEPLSLENEYGRPATREVTQDISQKAMRAIRTLHREALRKRLCALGYERTGPSKCQRTRT